MNDSMPRSLGRPPMEPEYRASRTVSIRITQAQRDALDELSRERGTTISGLVDMALDAFLEQSGYHPVVVALPDGVYYSLIKIARQTGNKNDVLPLVMEAIERYIEASGPKIK